MATEGFARAEELFDKMRRTVIAILDERDVDDPNVADLEDPTLDAFLEQLERESDLNELLGIPNRPRNLRVIRDWLLWEDQGAGLEGAGAEQAAANAMMRAQRAAQNRRNDLDKPQTVGSDQELSEKEMRRFAEAESMEEEIEKMLTAIEDRMKDPDTDEAQKQQLQKKAEMLANMLQDARNGEVSQRRWRELAENDEMKAMLRALAAVIRSPTANGIGSCSHSTSACGRSAVEHPQKITAEPSSNIRTRFDAC